MNNNNIEKLFKQTKNQAKKLGKVYHRTIKRILSYLSSFNISKYTTTIVKSIKNIHISLSKVKNSFYIALILTLVLTGVSLKSEVQNNTKQSASLTKLTIESGLPKISSLKQTQKESDFNIASYREKSNSEIHTSLGAALVPPKSNFQSSVPFTRTKIETYTVKPGDTVSTIANKFGLYWSTILWANDLNAWSVIQPGQELKILPINGIIHKVKKGENLSYIAEKYDSTIEQISQFNKVGDSITPGQTLIVPNGTPPPKPKPKPKPKPEPRPKPKPNKTFVTNNNDNYSYTDWRYKRFASSCHRFYRYPGQCTDWVAYKWALEQNQCVPRRWGNAKSWSYHARKDGYKVGSSPQRGAAIILDCGAYACNLWGHVAYVESYNSNHVTISELNANGAGKYQARTLLNKTGVSQNGWKILGYIYPLK